MRKLQKQSQQTTKTITTIKQQQQSSKKKKALLVLSPVCVLLLCLVIGVTFLGYNLKALSKAIHQELEDTVDKYVARQPFDHTNTANSISIGAAAAAGGAKKQQSSAAASNKNKEAVTTTTQGNQRNALEEEKIETTAKVEEDQNNNANNNKVPTYQIIFSTGCSAFQDWQSYVLFFHAAKILRGAKPPMSSMSNTHVTRIASGCTPAEAKIMEQYHKEQIEIMVAKDFDNVNGVNNFHLHLTPDFSHVHGDRKAYKYFNKPFGTKHWMEHALGYSNQTKGTVGANPHDDDIIILLDPDQIIMKPFTNDFSNHPEAWRRRNSLPIWDKVTHGQPFAQQYGFHSQWESKTEIKYIAKKEELPSPLEKMSRAMINENFSAGPPYIATGHDFYLIADKWAEFGVGVHQQYPNLLAEMFAYCLAAAHLQLPHQIAQSFMISDVGTGGLEGWKHYIDKYSETDVCTDGAIPPDGLPYVLHYCQRYWLGKWFIGKYKLPKDFISCKSPLLMVPPNDIATKYDFAIQPGTGDRKAMSKDHVKRNAFMLCHFIPALNEAARFYKENHCKDDNDPPNFKEELIFHTTMEIE